MTGVQIVLVGGPLDGNIVAVPEDFIKHHTPYRFRTAITPRYVRDEEILEDWLKAPRGIAEYRPMTVDFMGWPYPSITDDGTPRYLYAGEH